ncbi:unnamed protein product [Ilex paraguariensis]|uniref:Cyclin N-terminal domain-containing protein n=1 Tax=Ilex paraguariensis TaxID=185542 RepID=A0ABC8U433_9AQUA
MAAEGRNRRALGCIGNLVTGHGIDYKPLPHVSCPVTKISSDCEEVKKDKGLNKKNSGEGPSRKKASTLTSNESPFHVYMDTQLEINEKMSAILIDLLIDVHNKFKLMPEILYFTIIVDRYHAVKTLVRNEL